LRLGQVGWWHRDGGTAHRSVVSLLSLSELLLRVRRVDFQQQLAGPYPLAFLHAQSGDRSTRRRGHAGTGAGDDRRRCLHDLFDVRPADLSDDDVVASAARAPAEQ
jgi:hypothetical protein